MKKSTGTYLPKEGFVDVNIHANKHMYIDSMQNMYAFTKYVGIC